MQETLDSLMQFLNEKNIKIVIFDVSGGFFHTNIPESIIVENIILQALQFLEIFDGLGKEYPQRFSLDYDKGTSWIFTIKRNFNLAFIAILIDKKTDFKEQIKLYQMISELKKHIEEKM